MVEAAQVCFLCLLIASLLNMIVQMTTGTMLQTCDKNDIPILDDVTVLKKTPTCCCLCFAHRVPIVLRFLQVLCWSK